MGSLSRLSRANFSGNCHVYVSFCGKNPSENFSVFNWIERYNPANNSWYRVTSIPGLTENQVLKGFTMVSVGDSIYIIGGRLCQKEADHHDPEIVHEMDLKVLHSVLRYDTRKDKWYNCAPMSIPRSDFACSVSKNKIYVAGGQSTLGGAKGISLAEVYDPALDDWKSLPSMSTLRYKCVGVTWQENIHVVGGFAESENNDSPGPYNFARSSAEVYDSECQRWHFMARMWELDVPPNQIVAVNGRLFSSGDCLNPWKGHVEAYDGNLNMWDVVRGSRSDTLSSPICTETNWSPMQRLYLTMAAIGTYLYFLAGYRIPGESSRLKTEVHVFDTSANGDGWRSFEPIEEEGEKELCCHCCVVKQES